MFNQYSYKLKFKILIVLFFMLSVAAYRRSFSSLIDVLIEYKNLSKKVEVIGTKTKNITQMNQEIATLDKMIGKEGMSKESVQQGIVTFLLDNSKNVSINDMKPIHEFMDDNFKIYSYQLDLTGDFNHLAEVIYLFEKKFEYSKIVSTKFYTINKENKSNTLHLTLFFQNYENKNK